MCGEYFSTFELIKTQAHLGIKKGGSYRNSHKSSLCCSTMMMSNLSGGLGREEEDETPPPVIYIRYLLNRLYFWSALKTDVDLSDEPRICLCGAKATLSPCLGRTDGIFYCCSIAAVGSKIYTFGGYEGFSEQISDQVSCIDTLFPGKGWKLMNTIPTPAERAYTVTIDEDRVLLVGGLRKQYLNPTLTQMYYPKTDTWVPLVNTKIALPNMHGHGVVLADDNNNNKNSILMHSYQLEGLFSYNIDENCWDLHYQTDFKSSKHTAALVDGIYYVLDFSDYAIQQNLLFSGYDISKKPPSKRLPVQVMKMGFEKEEDELMPKLFPDNYMAPATLLSLGNSKLAMVWNYDCVPDDRMMCVWCSVFKMSKEFDAADGALKLVAQALSNSCYHVEGHLLHGCLVVCCQGYRSRTVVVGQKGPD